MAYNLYTDNHGPFALVHSYSKTIKAAESCWKKHAKDIQSGKDGTHTFR
jgi:hypothetical protein